MPVLPWVHLVSKLTSDWISNSLLRRLCAVWRNVFSRWQCFPSLQCDLAYVFACFVFWLLLLLVKAGSQPFLNHLLQWWLLFKFDKSGNLLLRWWSFSGYCKGLVDVGGIHPVSGFCGCSWIQTDTAELGRRITAAATDPQYEALFFHLTLVCPAHKVMSIMSSPTTVHWSASALNWLWLLWCVSELVDIAGISVDHLACISFSFFPSIFLSLILLFYFTFSLNSKRQCSVRGPETVWGQLMTVFSFFPPLLLSPHHLVQSVPLFLFPLHSLQHSHLLSLPVTLSLAVWFSRLLPLSPSPPLSQ